MGFLYKWSLILIIIVLITLVTLPGAAERGEDGSLAFLPIVLHITGTPEPDVTPMLPTATITSEPTITPTPTATPNPHHFNDCAFRTGNNATVAVPASVTISGDLVLAVDDEIAIFTPDGSICARMSVWDSENIAITAWGDDMQTEEVDGLRGGEKMMFRIWDKSVGKEIPVQEVTYAVGDGFFVANGIYVVSGFTLDKSQ